MPHDSKMKKAPLCLLGAAGLALAALSGPAVASAPPAHSAQSGSEGAAAVVAAAMDHADGREVALQARLLRGQMTSERQAEHSAPTGESASSHGSTGSASDHRMEDADSDTGTNSFSSARGDAGGHGSSDRRDDEGGSDRSSTDEERGAHTDNNSDEEDAATATATAKGTRAAVTRTPTATTAPRATATTAPKATATGARRATKARRATATRARRTAASSGSSTFATDGPVGLPAGLPRVTA